MRRFVSTAAAAALLATVPLAAQAVPGAPLTRDSQITLAAGGCGPAFHRGPLGGCRPNRVIVRPRVVCRVVGIIPRKVCRRVP